MWKLEVSGVTVESPRGSCWVGRNAGTLWGDAVAARSQPMRENLPLGFPHAGTKMFPLLLKGVWRWVFHFVPLKTVPLGF